ncbi:MAG: bifunctional phosphoribosylaminoimidazolecarboxamide formyltransferase/IMP cyclohydrolase, partial [Coprothermobacter proteolyticus]
MTVVQKRKALISVSRKEGVVELAKDLEELGFEIISTGGTYNLLKESGVEAVQVSDITGFPEILDGRVKTLHPFVHAGILANRSNPEHVAQLVLFGIEPIDLVVVNLYPFKETVLDENATMGDAIENIDIGGPTLIRAAAKNWESVTVLVDPQDYEQVIDELRDSGSTSLKTRFYLAAKAFRHTAFYDAVISSYFGKGTRVLFPEEIVLPFEKVQELR